LKNTAGKIVEDLEKSGIDTKSNSPWASPAILIDKSNDDKRLVIDYRKLNEITEFDAHPIPRIDDIFDLLADNSYFSTLDITSMYYQIPVSVSDRPKTAFIVL
jgi:putative pol protein